MITLFSRQRKSSPKVAVAVAIPYKEKQFYDCWERQSDFLDGLKDEWGTSDAKTFWLKYSNIARTISIALVELKKDGVEILDEFGERDFEKVGSSTSSAGASDAPTAVPSRTSPSAEARS